MNCLLCAAISNWLDTFCESGHRWLTHTTMPVCTRCLTRVLGCTVANLFRNIIGNRAEMRACTLFAYSAFKRLSNLMERSIQRIVEVEIIDVCKTRIQMIFVRRYFMASSDAYSAPGFSPFYTYELILFLSWLSLVLSSSISVNFFFALSSLLFAHFSMIQFAIYT